MILGIVSGGTVGDADIPWVPADASGLKSWLVSDDAGNTLVGGQLSVLRDLSGNTSSASEYASNPSNRALIISSGLNGRSVWRRQAADPTGALNISNGSISASKSGLTLAVVSKLSASIGTSDASVLRINVSGSSTSRVMIGRGAYGSNWVYAGGRRLDGDSFQYVTNAQDVGTDWLIVVAVFDYTNTDLKMSVNGTEYINSSFQTAGTTSSGSASSTGIGHRGDGPESSPAIGDYAEVIIYDAALVDSDRQKLEGYLAWQWGLNAGLPSGHPYKDSPPLA